MHAYDKAYDTPIYVGQRVVVVGGGNVAMDAVRTAKRLGAEATIVYRRSEKELPARVEEVHHAKEEGIRFRMLTNPTEVLGDEKGWVTGLRCVEMELGEPDESGRRSPVVKEGSEFEIACDVVIMALGTSPNPLLAAHDLFVRQYERHRFESPDIEIAAIDGDVGPGVPAQPAHGLGPAVEVDDPRFETPRRVADDGDALPRTEQVDLGAAAFGASSEVGGVPYGGGEGDGVAGRLRRGRKGTEERQGSQQGADHGR